jgi:Ca2+-binding EF-hand superfamily protein
MTLSKKTIGFVAGGVAAVILLGGGASVIAHGKYDRHGLAGPMGIMKDRMMSQVDTDADGAVSKPEAAAFLDMRFGAMDSDEDDALTPKEMSDGMRMMMFTLVDTNGDGQVSAAEFMEVTEGNYLGGHRVARLDDNGDGRVDRDEMADMLDKMFSRLDGDEDGMIRADEIGHRGHRD